MWARLRSLNLRVPKLSVIVVGYKMPRQVLNTLFTLSARYQEGVQESDYEVILVENDSDVMVSPNSLAALGDNFRYFRRQETHASPVNAVNFGVSKARAKYIAIMIDGARMVTPRVIQYMIDISRNQSEAVVNVPGYHIGKDLQQVAVQDGYDEAQEARLLSSVPWVDDGYTLFKVACFSGSSARGYFNDFSESNCLGVSKKRYLAIGGMDPRFNTHGGGYANLDLYTRLLSRPKSRLFLLFGEGCFHQFHGGVTTGARDTDRRETMQLIAGQYQDIRGRAYEPLEKPAQFYGRVEPSVWPFIKESIDKVYLPAAHKKAS